MKKKMNSHQYNEKSKDEFNLSTAEVVTLSRSETASSSSNENGTGEAVTTSTHHATTTTYHPAVRHTCRLWWDRILFFVQTHMAFKPPVTEDPRLFSVRKKRLILSCLAFGSSLNGLCSTIFLPGLPDIETELAASEMAVTLTTSLFILFGGIGPIMWGSMSDFYHVRRFLYLISLIVFTVASAGCALVTNIWSLVILRCVQSIGTSVTMSVGAGTVSDCWAVTERGAAFSILFVGQFFGPLVGPIIGGGLTTLLGWRSTFWFCVAYGMFLFCFLFMFLPETYRVDSIWRFDPTEEKQVDEEQPHLAPRLSRILSDNDSSPDATLHNIYPLSQHSSNYSLDTATSMKTRRRDSLSSTAAHIGQTQCSGEDTDNDNADINNNVNKNSNCDDDDASGSNSTSQYQQHHDDSRVANSSAPSPTPSSQSTGFNPLRSVLLLRHTFVWMIAIQTGICFGTMFTIETIIPDLYSVYYGFESWQTGLSFLGAGLGNILGSFISGAISDYLLKRSRIMRGGKALTEDRLTMNAWPGGFILVPAGVLVFGWGIQLGLVVWVSIVGFGIVCFGMSQVYAAGSAYLVDSIPGRGASVTAAANLLRMSIAGVLSLIARPTVDGIGTGFFMVLLAGLNVMGMISFAIVKWKGQTMRRLAGYGENTQ